ncbi:amino acid adenylation domain-containing protein [Streptomyces sp. NPDC059783]|uniref:amino acid adenylation domain-containing protein n=1 Tax=Streptomyces sp. NPDC059783 TaxID=3346944 RepID=UPI003662BA70
MTTTDPQPPPLLPDLVAAWGKRSPGAPAVRLGDDVLGYAALDELARRVAAGLLALGVRPEDRVAVPAERGVLTPALFLGLWRAGCVLVPLSPSHPAERTRRVLADSAPRLLVAEHAPEPAGALPVVTPAELLHADPPVGGLPRLHPDQLAYLLYTSGSTGSPKGVAVAHRSLAHCLTAAAADTGIGPGDRLLAVTGWTFDIAFLETFLPLVSGAETVLADSGTAADGRRLAALLDSARPTFLHATPALWEMLFLARWAGDPLMHALCGGDVVAPRLAARLTACTASVRHLYGPTETTMFVLSRTLTTGPQPPVLSAGTPLPGVTATVADEGTGEVPQGATGELWVGGAAVSRGYFGRPAATAARFVPDPRVPGGRLYRTGDLARRRPDGDIELHGRRDVQVKIRGHRIEPGEVEHVLTRHPGLSAACVVPVDVRGETVSLTAFLCVRSAQDPSRLIAEVRERASACLPEVMRPAGYAVLPGLPLTVNGKVDRALLRRLAATRRPSPVAPVAGPGTVPATALLPERTRLVREGHPGLPAAVFLADGPEEERDLRDWIASVEPGRAVWLAGTYGASPAEDPGRYTATTAGNPEPHAATTAENPEPSGPSGPFVLAGLRGGAAEALRIAGRAYTHHGQRLPVVAVDPAGHGAAAPPPGLVHRIHLAGPGDGPAVFPAAGPRRTLTLRHDGTGRPSADTARRLAALVSALG